MNPRRSNTPLVVITILVCVAILGVLNYLQRKSSPTEAEQQAQQQQDAQAAQTKAAAKAAAPISAVPAPDLSHPLPTELLIGNPAKAKIKVTIGYTYDDAAVQHPEAIAAALKAAQDWIAKHPDDSLKIVCLDLPPDQLTNPADASVPLGVVVNGNSPFGPNMNPGEDNATLDHVQSLFSGLP